MLRQLSKIRGARKGSHFGWNNGYGTKIYLCNVCGKEHTYGDMAERNQALIESYQKAYISIFAIWGFYF